MTRRTYGQYCGLAKALDLIGERWTLLVVRDLAVAPRRFSDLLAGLPGVGTSMLSDRLRTLESEGLARRVVAPAPDRGVVYELTGAGERLALAMAPLARWGAARLVPSEHEQFRPEWLAFTIRAMFRPDAARGVDDCYELRVGDDAIWVVVDDGEISVSTEQPRPADFVVVTDIATLAALGTGELSPEDAANAGRAEYSGDPAAGLRALQLLGATPAGPVKSAARRGRRRSKRSS